MLGFNMPSMFWMTLVNLRKSDIQYKCKTWTTKFKLFPCRYEAGHVPALKVENCDAFKWELKMTVAKYNFDSATEL